MKSPFKFLDAYTLEDKDIFFGRKQEIDTLYRMLYKSPLVMVYGLSGTGKTSLIQCGLAARFDGPDWLPFFIRRQDNINESLSAALSQVSGLPLSGTLTEKVGRIFRYYLRPAYLIFDQFEELFILGSVEEQQQFVESIRQLLDDQMPCRVMLVMREEYLGHLYDFEKVLPYLFDYRLRVEPMSANRVKDVMLASFEQFNISVEEPAEQRLEEMIDNISSGKARIHLPYLQIYLDRLYREDYMRTYKKKAPETDLPPLEFTKAEIEKMGTIDEVLEKFLQEQEINLQEELAQQFQDFPKMGVRTILDAFVTEEGTKRPVPYDRKEEILELSGPICELIPPMSATTLSALLQELEKRRILRFSDDQIELAHDSLAQLIDQKRTDEQRQRNEILRRIKNNFVEHRQTGEYLSQKQLNVYSEYLPHLSLDPAILTFIDASHEYVKELEKEKLRQQQQEIELINEKKMARRRTVAIVVITILALIAGVFGFFAYQAREAAIAANEGLAVQTIESIIGAGEAYKLQANYDPALAKLKEARDRAKGFEITPPPKLDTLEKEWSDLRMLVNRADSLSREDSTILTALSLYEDAFAVQQDSIISYKIKEIEATIDRKFNDLLFRATAFANRGRCYDVHLLMDLADFLKPGHPLIKGMRDECPYRRR